MSSKLKDALEHTKAADKALKTGFLKWNPDYDTAASEYTKAATNYKLAGSPEKAKDAYIKAADIQRKLGSLFHSAKLLTQAAGIAADLKEAEEVVDLMERACSLYREHGAPDTAAMTLSKAGKMCEMSLPDKSIDLYLKAADLCENDDKVREACDYLNQAVRMQLKQKRGIKSAETMKKRIVLLKQVGNVNMAYNVTLGMVITYLSEGDYVSANDSYNGGFSLSGFGESDQAMYCEHFLKAFEEGDEDLLTKTRSQPTVLHLDTELARLAKSLRLSEVDVPSKPTSGLSELEEFEQNELNEDAESETVADDFEGGLC